MNATRSPRFLYAQAVVPQEAVDFAVDQLVATLPYGRKLANISDPDDRGRITVTIRMESA